MTAAPHRAESDSPKDTILSALFSLALLPAAMLCVIAIFVLAVPGIFAAIAIETLRFRVRRRRFLRRWADSTVVVVSSRRGWVEFAENNIRPQLADPDQLIFDPPVGQRPHGERAVVLDILGRTAIQELGPRPWLVTVRHDGCDATSIRDALMPLKLETRRRDAAVQQRVRDALPSLVP